MKRSLFLSLIVSCCVGAAYGQNLISNGSFEADPHAPSSDMTAWMVGGTGHIHSIAEGATTGTYSAAFSVGQILGPSFAGYLYDRTGSLAAPSWAAAIALAISGLLAFRQHR